MIRYQCDICGKDVEKRDVIECTMNVLNSSENMEVQLCKECAGTFAGGMILRKWRSLGDICEDFNISTHRCTADPPSFGEIHTYLKG